MTEQCQSDAPHEAWDAADRKDAALKLAAISSYMEQMENFDDAAFLRRLAHSFAVFTPPPSARDELSEDARARLKVMYENTDVLGLAEQMPAPAPSSDVAEIIRLLHQRYRDNGDKTSRKAAWALEDAYEKTSSERAVAMSQFASKADYEAATLPALVREESVTLPKPVYQAALNYIQHVGANHVMRGEPHPQQWIVDGLLAVAPSLNEEKQG